MEQTAAGAKSAKRKKAANVSRQRKPKHLSAAEWQKQLRQQFGADRRDLFEITFSAGEHPVFGDYRVKSVQSGAAYKVALRAANPGPNFCTCLDFKTNALGTCKHVEAVLRHVREKKKLAPKLNETYQPAYTSVYLKYGPERAVMLRIGTERADAFAKLARGYFDGAGRLRPDAIDAIDAFLTRAAAIDGTFRCYDDAMEHLIALRDRRKREELFAPDKTELVNGLIDATLYPYQVHGVLFAARAGRALIADEMGLGKTIQALSLSELLRKERGIRCVLIVVPTSLKYQWQSEIEKFTKSANIVVEGDLRRRRAQYEADAAYTITGYNVIEADHEAIARMEPDLVILDEAQRIKNWDTKTSRAVKKIRSRYALVLTGTPIENKLEELYSIVQFLDPFALGPLYRFLENHQIRDEHGKVTGYRDLGRISDLLKDLVLRRTKKEVLSQLPERVDQTIFVPLTDEQRRVHNEYGETVARLVSRWKRYGFLDEASRRRLMISLNCMRMASDSTYILDEETRHDTKLDELSDILDSVFESGDEKAVIFSEWQRMTGLVSEQLERKGIGFVHLNGGVPSSKRKALLDAFRDDPECRVFLSTNAGGVGLNLQSASLIINLDIPWNPAVLEQRIGRVFRHGQTRKVRVLNLVSRESIEERMLDVLSFKSSLFSGVLDNGANEVFMSEGKFSKFMKTVETVTDAPPTPQTAADKETDGQAAGRGSSGAAPAAGAPNTAPITELSEAARELSGVLSDLGSSGSAPNLLHVEDGKTYAKIPIEQVGILTRALAAITNILRQFGK